MEDSTPSDSELQENNSNRQLNERDYSSQLEERYYTLLILFKQKKYRKVRTDICKLVVFSECGIYWKVMHLKIKCHEKIIEKKFQNNHDNIKTNSIFKWLEINEKEINHWFNEYVVSSSDKRDILNKLELVITFLLTQCLNYAKYCLQQEDLVCMISFLGLAENLIKRTSEFLTSPDSMLVIQRIYLLSSSIYITNDNYLTAKNYLISALKLAFKEIELRTHDNFQSLIILDKLNNDEQEKLYELLFNITTAMYQLGICFENEGQLDKAHYSYTQNVEKRIRLRIDLCHFFKEEEKNLDKETIKEPPKALHFQNEKEKMKKFEKIKEYIEGIKLNEIDDNEADLLDEVGKKPLSQKVKLATKTVQVLNHLMSSQFQDVIKEMDKIEINNLNELTKKTIQRKIVSLKNTQRMKLMIKEKNQKFRHRFNTIKEIGMDGIPCSTTATIPTLTYQSSSNTNIQMSWNKTGVSACPRRKSVLNKYSKNISLKYNSIQNTSVTSKFKQKIDDEFSFDRKNDSYFNQYFPSQNISGSKEITYYNTLETNPNHSLNSQSKKSKSKKKITFGTPTMKPEIYNCSHYVFNKVFKKKIDNFKKQFDKELIFQKDLLTCKKNETAQVDFDVNHQEIRKNCEIFYEKELKNQKKKVKEQKEKEMKVFMLKQLQKYRIKKGNSPLTFTQLFKFRNPPLPNLSNKQKMVNSEKINKTCLNNIEYDLEKITQSQENLMKRMKNK